MLHQAYVYPARMKATRDLLRRRNHFMHKRRALKYLEKLTLKQGKGKVLAILAHKLGRAVYFMLKR